MEFRCSPGESNSSQADQPWIGCAHDGLCAKSSDLTFQLCQCTAGWKADLVGFAHFENCTLPEGFLLIFFIVYSCISLPLLVGEMLIVYRTREILAKYKGRSVKLGSIILWHFLNWVHVLCVFLQDGFFEAALITLCLYASLGFILGAQTVNSFVQPLVLIGKFKRSLKHTQRLFWVIFIGAALILSIIVLVAVPFCRETNPTRYNAIMFAMIAESVLAVAVTQSALILTSWRVYKAMFAPHSGLSGNGTEAAANPSPSSNNSGKLTALQARLRLQMRGILVITISFFLGDGLALGILCVWAVYGSFPYMYIGWAVQFLMGLSTYPLAYSLLRRTIPVTSNVDGVTSNAASVERRGVETIVIHNGSGFASSKRRRIVKLTKNLVGQRRRQSSSQKQQLSKIVEEG